MKDDSKKDLEEIDSVTKEIAENIENLSSILFYVGHDGEVVMLSTGKTTKIQNDIASKMLIAAGDHSIILKIVLSLEILFEKLIYKVSQWFKPKST
tara:strand:- start:4547 stop:4834 length:288 start_codon:yes stop_codon:yes gene_type:complete